MLKIFFLFYVQNCGETGGDANTVRALYKYRWFDFVYNDGAFILQMCFGKSNAFFINRFELSAITFFKRVKEMNALAQGSATLRTPVTE